MVKRGKKISLAAILALILLVFGMGTVLYAEEEPALSDDNSLSSLGIMTADVTVSPDFSYDIWTYDVVVPAGTEELELDPVPSNAAARIADIKGTVLDEEGNGQVVITVVSESDIPIDYILNVTSEDEDMDPAQAISENEAAFAQTLQTETPPEPQTEDTRYVKVDRNSLQEAENTIERLQKEIEAYKDRNTLFTYVIYGLIAACVLLLFIVINLLLRRRDNARELKAYRMQGGPDMDPDSYAGAYPEDEDWLDDEDDWGEWPEEKGRNETPPAPRKEKGGNVQTSWTQTQVGTPVEPSRRSRSGRNPGQPSHNLDDTRLYRGGSGRDGSARSAGSGSQETKRVPGDRTRMIRRGKGTDDGRNRMEPERKGSPEKGRGGQDPAFASRAAEEQAKGPLTDAGWTAAEDKRFDGGQQQTEGSVSQTTKNVDTEAVKAAMKANPAAGRNDIHSESNAPADNTQGSAEGEDRKNVQIDMIDL